MLSKPYLIAYNAVVAAGWAWIMVLTLSSLRLGPSENTECAFYDTICFDTSKGPQIFHFLKIFQTAACLEVFHVMLGLVKGTLFTTFFQVFSREILTWLVCFINPRIQFSSAFFLMLTAWSVTEVIRYNLYWIKLALGTVPYPLMWCRYSFFIVLYPLGVYSEILCNLRAIFYYDELHDEGKFAADTEENAFTFTLSRMYGVGVALLMLLYPTVFPQMYMYMFVQRKKYLSARKPRPAQTEGIQFPPDDKGKRSTSGFNQAAFAASIFNTDPKAAMSVMKEKNWRFGYQKHVVRNVAAACRATDTCLNIARDGLKFLHDNFEFVRNGEAMPLSRAMATIKGSFQTMEIKGAGQMRKDFVVPYVPTPYPKESDVQNLTGEALKKQLAIWAQNGSIEPSARDAIAMVADHKEWLDLSDKYFVLLGAGSAMGPYEVLLAHGANIVAVDLNRPNIWKRLVNLARKSPGRIIFPVSADPSTLTDDEKLFAAAGCDLFLHTPEICNWLKTVIPSKELIIGSYAYLDGEKHVRVSIAMDAIIQGVIEARKTTTSLAYLCSPTDVFVVDKEAHDAAQANYKRSGLAKTVGGFIKLLKKTAMQKNHVEPATSADGKHTYYINDGVVVAQGPNYALAKRIQHWRAMLARSQGCPVSTNIAPSTATLSVVHNPQFKAAYGGFPFFHPFEVARQETSNAVMGALLIHDMCNKRSKAYPSTDLGNPINLFKPGAFHGGVWRCGYKVGSIGETAVTVFYLTNYGIQAAVALGASVGGLAYYFCA